MSPRDGVPKLGVVTFDEVGVTRALAAGGSEGLAWSELVQVEVWTTDGGPVEEDVFFMLSAGDHGCVVPQGVMPDGLLERLQALPGFDNEALIRAMSSTASAQFRLWNRPAAA